MCFMINKYTSISGGANTNHSVTEKSHPVLHTSGLNQVNVLSIEPKILNKMLLVNAKINFDKCFKTGISFIKIDFTTKETLNLK